MELSLLLFIYYYYHDDAFLRERRTNFFLNIFFVIQRFTIILSLILHKSLDRT